MACREGGQHDFWKEKLCPTGLLDLSEGIYEPTDKNKLQMHFFWVHATEY